MKFSQTNEVTNSPLLLDIFTDRTFIKTFNEYLYFVGNFHVYKSALIDRGWMARLWIPINDDDYDANEALFA